MGFSGGPKWLPILAAWNGKDMTEIITNDLLRGNDQAPRKLLLVDDEANILTSLKRMLRNEGYQVFTAGSGQEGLEILKHESIGVIISDQRMPGMNGTEFLSQVKELYPETVRIVLSGYTELETITSAINRGAIYRFLTKPWDDAQLKAHIAEAFQHYTLKNENLRLLALNRAMVDAVSDVLLLVDLVKGCIVSANRRAMELLDYPQEKLIGLPISAIETLPQDLFYWEEIAGGNFYPVVDLETEYRRAGGDWIPVRKSTASARDDHHYHVVVIARDMTRERAIEQTLELTNSQLGAIFESVADGILVLDTEQRLLRMNHRLLELWRFPESLVQDGNGQPLLQWIGERAADPAGFAVVLHNLAVDTEATYTGRLALRTGKMMEWNATPQRLGNKIVGRIFSFLDISASA